MPEEGMTKVYVHYLAKLDFRKYEWGRVYKNKKALPENRKSFSLVYF